jgi:hypothetical protein
MVAVPFYRRIVLLLVLPLALWACSDPPLSPSTAKDNIIASIRDNHCFKSAMAGEPPVPSFGEIHREGNLYYGMLSDEEKNKGNLEKLNAAVQKGLLIISKTEQTSYQNSGWYKITVTDKAKDLVTVERVGSRTLRWGPVKLGDITVIEVTRLSEPQKVEDQKICRAEFTYRYKPTAFGELYLSPEDLRKTYRKSALFVLEDGGWKVSPEGLTTW